MQSSNRNSALEALLSAAIDGMIVMDVTGIIQMSNPAVSRMLGWRPADLVGQSIGILMDESNRTRHPGYLKNYLRNGVRKVIGASTEVNAQHKNGNLVPILLSVGEAMTPDGSLYVGIMRDLTEQRRRERRQVELEEQLDHVGRLHLLGELTAGIAHEINQPLSAISTYAQAGRRLIATGQFSDEEMLSLLQNVSDQALRAGDVISNLRSFIRKRHVEKKVFDPNEMIEDVMNLVDADARGSGIVVGSNLGANLPLIEGNAVQLQQVLLNLTHNGVEAMKDSKKPDKELFIRSQLGETGRVRISVHDRGHGVAKGLADAVFHPFVTTKEHGLGVGLAISRSIVQAHGGTLTYRPNPGGGSIFELELPVSVRSQNPIEPEYVGPADVEGTGKWVAPRHLGIE